ncbi:ABC transporter permease [Aureivirga sp. CE67]|uniref:ABC transporter permease n=1 Tax=Aureivirga sp. CE67 TaxID=1788983 RepID=UPI0018CAEADD|nr:ABC transporter permease [Aureivirga sp. CE67]
MFKILFKSTYYQFLIYLRMKQAVFFSLAFPVFLLVIFGKFWGADSPEYIYFLMTGVIGMTIASDGMFAIGPVIKEYYENGLIKYMRKMPFNILWHFMGLILSRIISLFITVIVVCLTAYFVFGLTLTGEQILNLIYGVFIGLFVFAFLGLSVSFISISNLSDKGLTNIIYFGVLFTSNAFYPVYEFNKSISAVGDMLPLNPILDIIRHANFHYVLIFWIIIPPVLFSFLFKRVKFTR